MTMNVGILDSQTLRWLNKRKRKDVIIKLPMSKAKKRFLLRIFDGFDTDGSGAIDLQEFSEAYKFVQGGTEGGGKIKMKKMFDEMDVDGGGLITFDEFCLAMTTEVQDTNEIESIKRATSLRNLILDHQRESELAIINNSKISDPKKLGKFQALYKTHALSLPSSDMQDAKQVIVIIRSQKPSIYSSKHSIRTKHYNVSFKWKNKLGWPT